MLVQVSARFELAGVRTKPDLTVHDPNLKANHKVHKPTGGLLKLTGVCFRLTRVLSG